MPQVQFVDSTENKPEPTGVEQFFSKLGKSLKDKKDQEEIGNIISSYQQNREDANAWEDLQLNLQKSNVSPTKRLQAQSELNAIRKNVLEKDKALNAHTSALEAQAKKKAAETAAIEKKAKEEAALKDKATKTAAEVKEILTKAGETEEEAQRLSTILTPSSANARYRTNVATQKVEDKKTEKQKSEDKEKQIAQKAYDNIVQLVPDAGVGTGALSYFGGKNAKTLGEFTSLTGALESILVDKVSRGTLSNARFNYIKDTLLPKATDTQAEIKGKLKGLATILELDDASLQQLDEKKSKKKETRKAPEGKVRVMLKGSNPPQYGSVTPYPGMEQKYDVVK